MPALQNFVREVFAVFSDGLEIVQSLVVFGVERKKVEQGGFGGVEVLRFDDVGTA